MGLTYFSNRPLVLFGILLIIVGVQLISMGLLGEMLVKNSSTGTGQYLIREQIVRGEDV